MKHCGPIVSVRTAAASAGPADHLSPWTDHFHLKREETAEVTTRSSLSDSVITETFRVIFYSDYGFVADMNSIFSHI